MGIGMLLYEGIGDTIRISLAADPVEEVKVGFDILKSLKLRSNGINFVACPSCSRQNFDVIGTMNELEKRLEDMRTPMDVAVIGCIVNGPARHGRRTWAHRRDAEQSHLRRRRAGSQGQQQDFVDHLEQVIRERAAKPRGRAGRRLTKR
jgi:(E)-4-hydroxy-3-methylbut-2-enyl-diphosphate synthase